MSTIASRKERTAAVLLIIVTALTLIQGVIPNAPGITEGVITTISTIIMYLVSTLTIWRQRLSEEVSNAATAPVFVLVAIAALAGLNDVFNVVLLSEKVDQWVRFAITVLTLLLNMFSKMTFPTPITKSDI